MKPTKERFSKIHKIGLDKDYSQDLFHQILTMSWSSFFIFYILFFLTFNLFFAELYWIDAGGISNTESDFFKNFAFSVQTFSTIGYGVFSPTNYYTHSLVIVESLLGVLFTALLTGLTFAKFSKPIARIRFTDKVVITNYNGKRALMFRLANLRANLIAEASINASLLITEKTTEGHVMRMQKDLVFIRKISSFFILSWTVIHIIDENSPLYHLTAEDIIKQNVEMSVSVIGHDETLSQMVHSSGIYSSEDFVFDRIFEDIIISVNGKIETIDYTKFNCFKPS